jgi:hypothetical protein
MNPIFQLLHILVVFLGTDRVVVTGIQPNPGGDAQLLEGQGWYCVAPSSRSAELKLVAEFPGTGQLVWREPACTSAEWQGKLQIPAGEYDCWAELVTKDATGKTVISRSQRVRLTVK